ncbi:Endonuclease/exonuclease/phosphatase [Armillaria novae-zelandiae]|uniref:Endonuclease/exonuclease/phosphatase n=1 Tax=Armillaria novae-zelandiae TaxID=153914 RepID=A0AA39NL18_9AGAR|nr:Endonuclease/exonuclease/phosphatase [Armillaria novae-zelandiae]
MAGQTPKETLLVGPHMPRTHLTTMTHATNNERLPTLAPATTQAGRGQQTSSDPEISSQDKGGENNTDQAKTTDRDVLSLGTMDDPIQTSRREQVLGRDSMRIGNDSDSPEPDTPYTPTWNNNEPNTECAEITEPINDIEDISDDPTYDGHADHPICTPPPGTRRKGRKPPKAKAVSGNKRTKAWWTIASLNMKGRGAQNPLRSKWADVNRMMREQKISLLTLQETHLSRDYADEVLQMYGKSMEIFFSADERNPTGKAGVAVVLNKNLIQTEGVVTTDLILGRALFIQVPWHRGTYFNWLAIYTLNDDSESKLMWDKLTTEWETCRLPRIDGMSGDFNLVEDALDRLPAHEDQRAVVEAFMNFRRNMNLRDGWRNANPDTKDFTFTQMAGNFSRSRIDRIYVSVPQMEDCEKWEIKDPPLSTDHRAIYRAICRERTMDNAATSPEKREAIKEIEAIVKEMASNIQNINERRTEGTNLQTIYAEGKKRMIQVLQRYAKCSIPVKKAKMEQLQAELDAILQDDTTDEDSRLLSTAILQQKIQQIRREMNEGRQTSNMATHGNPATLYMGYKNWAATRQSTWIGQTR